MLNFIKNYDLGKE